MARKPPLKLTDREICEMFADPEWSKKFPPLLDADEAATLAHVPLATIYDWSSRGLLDNCAHKRHRLQIVRNRFIRFLLEK